jgi:hypothetical protein
VGQGDSLESPGQALAGAPRQAQGRGSGGDDVDRHTMPPQAIPLALQVDGPVGEQMGLVEEDDRSAAGGGGLGAGPQALPEARHAGLRAVARDVQGARPLALGQLQEEARLANLPGTGEELDAAGRGLGEPPGEHLAALPVTEPELRIDHTRIIIRLCLKRKRGAPPPAGRRTGAAV